MPEEEFQILQTIYLADESNLDKIEIGKKINWDSKNSKLKVGSITISVKQFPKNIAGHSIDSMICWIVAKENDKIKLFCVLNKNDREVGSKVTPKKTIFNSEKIAIEENVDRIAPVMEKAIGKGFWQVFENDQQELIIGSLMRRVMEIKSQADEIYLITDPSHKEQLISQIIDAIDELVRAEIALEKFDVDNIRRYWEEKLSEINGVKVWQSLNRETKSYLETGELVCRFLDNQPNLKVDWTAVNVEYYKAIEVEINQKLFKKFRQWLKTERTSTFKNLCSEEAKKQLHQQTYSFIAKNESLTLGSFQYIFSKLDEGSEKCKFNAEGTFLELLENFIEFKLGEESQQFIEKISNLLRGLDKTRNKSIHSDFLGRDYMKNCVAKMNDLIPEIIRFSN
ncbi:MAG TPA: hypothetical protein V6D28_19515 [Leptolyngbyaceae cyanobacterium]